MGTQRLASPRPHDPTGELRPSGDVLTTNGEQAPDPADDLIQRIIGGRYRIEDVLGRGGMGVVYRATHLELDQEVAIKVLPTSYARDSETLKRFEREAKTASRVRHPNVVTVFDLGRLDSGEPYLVMELLDGRDLAQVMHERGTLGLDEVVDILAPIAAALDALHLEGVVHRDIKPSNIFFTKTKAMGEIVKLVDFGLAALHESKGTERLTRTGHVVGTAVYMAPEAARGDLSGPAGDIYALGVVAFELLTAMAPFDGQPMAVLMDKVSGPAPSLSALTGKKYPASVEGVFARVLERAIDKRPATATQFVTDLRAALRDRASMPPPGLTRPEGSRSDAPTSNERLASAEAEPGGLPTRSRAPLVAGLALALVGLAAAGWWSLRAPAPETPAPVAVPTLAPGPAPAPSPTPTPASGSETAAAETAAAETAAAETAVAETPPTPTAAAPEPVPAFGRSRTTPAPHTTTVRAHTTSAATTEPEAAPPASATTEARATAPSATTAERPASEASSTDRSADLVRQAQSAMLHGQIADARGLYEEATQASPRMAAAWRGLGLASERLGLVPEARRAYERYLSIAPDARDAQTVRDRLDRLAP